MWHVGFFYRLGDLLKIIEHKSLNTERMLTYFPTYQGVETHRLIKLALTGRWIEKDGKGILRLTASGKAILSIPDLTIRLHSQVRNLMEILFPPWAATMVHGRKAFAKYAPLEVVQCFSEAGLLDSLDYDDIVWWDRIAARYRKGEDAIRVETGRKGERLSFEYELSRTGEEPYWIALEYEGAGCDLVSVLSTECSEKLFIEVKTSTEIWGEAKFYITRNEWDTLNGKDYAVLHLWSLAKSPLCHAVIPIEEVKPHFPKDRGSGHWEVFECPFSEFPTLISS